MGLFNGWFNKPAPSVSSRKTYNYLIAAALQEELGELYKLSSKIKRHQKVEGNAVVLSIEIDKKREIEVLTYSCNKMGMPYNAAALMKIMCIHEPIYTFFIGTCGCVSDKHSAGDVLVPHRIFHYESGKHNSKGNFESDYMSYDTDDEIRKYAEVVKNRVSNKFKVVTDENFCSGAAIIDDAEKKKKILEQLPRKVSGLDMEAFSLACIQNILIPEGKKIGVIKGISDMAENKDESEKDHHKSLAISNSAKFTLELIKYIDQTVLGNREVSL